MEKRAAPDERFTRILIPVDASPATEGALSVGCDLAQRLGARVTGLYVMDSSAYASMPGDLEWDSIKNLMAKESGDALERIKAACASRGVTCETAVREGHPAQRIVELSPDFDLIVMATHGRSGLEHLLLGSVTERVIRQARCPVLVVRAKPER